MIAFDHAAALTRMRDEMNLAIATQEFLGHKPDPEYVARRSALNVAIDDYNRQRREGLSDDRAWFVLWRDGAGIRHTDRFRNGAGAGYFAASVIGNPHHDLDAVCGPVTDMSLLTDLCGDDMTREDRERLEDAIEDQAVKVGEARLRASEPVA